MDSIGSSLDYLDSYRSKETVTKMTEEPGMDTGRGSQFNYI